MPSPLVRIRASGRTLRRAVLRRRRSLAALCAAGAVAAGLHATTAPPPPTTVVLTAARDLPAGATLTPEDLRRVEFAAGSDPAGAVSDPVGETLAGPVRRGEPLTDVRLVGDALARSHPDLVTLPVRLPDPAAAALLEPGDRIDLVATDPQSGETRDVASGALVLATPDAAPEASGSMPGVVVVLGVAPLAVRPVAQASVRSFLSYAWTR